MSQTTMPQVRRSVCVGSMFVAACIATGASAQAYRPHERYARPGYVVAESQWGHGTIRGAVRRGRHGLQVRMPGGTWIDCVRSCSETLRLATVDFWQSQGGRDAKDGGPGYFRWEFRY